MLVVIASQSTKKTFILWHRGYCSNTEQKNASTANNALASTSSHRHSKTTRTTPARYCSSRSMVSVAAGDTGRHKLTHSSSQ